jgi:HAD superfamily hydrolase (TIGR01490 family)
MAGRIAAFFDFDKTLLQTDSGSLGFRFMWRRREVTPGFLARIALASLLYKRRLISPDSMGRIAIKHYRGRPIRQFLETAEEFYRDALEPNLSPAMLAKLEEHRAAGHYLVLLSASIDYYLRPVARELKFDELVCSRLLVTADGICTGRPDGPLVVGPHKLTAARALAQRENLDLAASYAYGDHASDLPLLEAFGHPVAVRPAPALRAAAEQHGWPIIDEA